MKLTLGFLFLVCGLVPSLVVTALNLDDISDPTVKDFFKTSNYVRAYPPKKSGTKVLIGLYVVSMTLDHKSMSMRFHGYLRQSWVDARFAPLTTAKNTDELKRIMLESSAIDFVWKPDTFIVNAMDVNPIYMPDDQKLFRINSTNGIWFVHAVDFTVKCKHGGSKAVCPIMFESFEYVTDVLDYKWLPAAKMYPSDANIERYQLEDMITYDCSVNYTAGAFPCLRVDIHLQETFDSAYSSGVFAVTFMLVIFSWIGFWIEGDQMTQRVGLGLMVALLLVLCNNGVNTSVSLGHSHGMHVWTTFCAAFGMIPLLEYLLIHVTLGIIPQKIKRISNSNYELENDSSLLPFSKWIHIIDALCGLVLMPLIFLIFNMVYWFSGYFHKNQIF